MTAPPAGPAARSEGPRKAAMNTAVPTQKTPPTICSTRRSMMMPGLMRSASKRRSACSRRCRVGAQRVMRLDPTDAPVVVQLHALGGDQPLDALIMEQDAAGAGIRTEEHEVQIGIARQRRPPVRPGGALAAHRHPPRAEERLGERRGDLHVLAVVVQDALEVAAVPSGDPLQRELLRL